MNNSVPSLPTTRREFLRMSGSGIGLLAFSHFAPSFLVQSTLAATPAPEKDRSILVLVQLAGGNDGLNTVVPFEDSAYYRLRPTLGVPKDQVLRVSDTLGLHPSCAALHELFKDGKVSIVQNVGYPNPNRSHFRSTDIWQSASDSDELVSTGWVGRFLDNTCSGVPTENQATDPNAIHLTGEVPSAFISESSHATFGFNSNLINRRDNQRNLQLLESLVRPATEGTGNVSFLRQTAMNALVTEKRVQKILGAYKPGTTYPGSPFAQSLRNVAALISAGLSTRVYFVSLGGFDTHANQTGLHPNLLRTLSEALAAFQKDLEAHKLDDQVMTMTFSEFGRRPNENLSRGTDHGTAAPLFVLGKRVKGGLQGTPPSLQLEKNQDLKFSTDFRQVYATVLDRWLGATHEGVLGKKYQPLNFV